MLTSLSACYALTVETLPKLDDASLAPLDVLVLCTTEGPALDAEELFAVFKGLGKDVTVGTLSNMLRLADKDGSGTIGFEEFQKIIQAL